jgi:uncharacterized protein (UPF0548 family)
LFADASTFSDAVWRNDIGLIQPPHRWEQVYISRLLSNGTGRMWTLRRPKEARIIEYLLAAARRPLNYTSVSSLGTWFPATRIQRRIHLGTGVHRFRQAAMLMRQWRMLPPRWVEIYWRDRGLASGTSLAVRMRMAGVHFVNPCRITEVVDDSDGTAEGGRCLRITWRTISGHSLRGSESFCVFMDPRSDDVWYEISSVAAPVWWLAPMRPWIDRIRRRFQRETCNEMALQCRTEGGQSHLSEPIDAHSLQSI